jgi:NAD(P)-dependent dehydrogenase (short-subunit alcohol dehydrogenase family)
MRFAQLGYRVLAGIRKAADGDSLKLESPGKIETVNLDVTDADSIKRAVAAAGDDLAGLINNAGIAAVGPLELVPVEAWRRQFEVNVIGLVAVTQSALPLLRRSRGRIVNIGSIAGRSALPGSGAYDATKFALEAITDSLRMELHASGVSVSLVEPGAIATPIWEKCLRDVDELSRSTDPEVYAPYRNLMKVVRKEAEREARKALPVQAVVKAVEHALTARRPKTRYLAGAGTRLWLLLNFLPDRWRDRLILGNMDSGS